MTEGGTGPAPLTPEEEASVSRMLADAAGPVPMPAEVAARLDEVLAGLEDDRAATQPQVVPLAARRRWPRVLLAAAAVVVGGYAVGTVATQGTLSGSDSSSAGDAAVAGAAEEAPSDSALLDQDGAESESTEDTRSSGDTAANGSERRDEGFAKAPAESLSGQGYAALRVPVRLRSDRLDAGVRRALRVLEASPGAELTSETADQACPGPELADQERSLPVRYDGEAAVLVAGPERSGTVEVTVHSCAGDELDSTLVRP